MKRTLAATAILLLAGAPSPAHRLDEYLQGTLISLEKSRMDAQITLTPGVAVFPKLIAEMDTDGDGAISATEQRAYVGRVLRDLSITIDGRHLTPTVASVQFPAIEEMKEGRGEIQIEIGADLPRGGPNRKLIFENRHQNAIAAYQVNCLVPHDPGIRIVSQNRNYSQSFYELDFVESDARSSLLSLAWLSGAEKPLGTAGLLLVAWLALLWGQRAHARSRSSR
jgi:hypothetical protein